MREQQAELGRSWVGGWGGVEERVMGWVEQPKSRIRRLGLTALPLYAISAVTLFIHPFAKLLHNTSGENDTILNG